MDNASSFVFATASTDPTDDGPLTGGPDFGMTINAILKIIFYAIVMILGVSGNSLILKVYWSKRQKTSTHVLIMGLAWVDLVVCVCRVNCLNFFICVLLGRDQPAGFIAIGIVNFINVYASVIVTCAITLERYDCVCRSGKRLLNHRWSKLMFIGSYFASTALCVPGIINEFSPSAAAQRIYLVLQLTLYLTLVFIALICYWKVYQAIRKHVKVNALSRHGPGTSWSAAVESDNRRQEASVSIPPALPLSDGRPLGAVFSVTASEAGRTNPTDAPGHLTDVPPSTRTPGPARQNHQDDRELRPPNPQARDNPTGTTVELQRKTTRMLFVTSVVFLVTWLPYWLYVGVALHASNGGNIHSNVLLVMYNCSLFVYINNVVNPFIYGLANRRFRKDCFDVINKLRCW